MNRLKRPSPAMIVAVLALFVALGGTGYAAFRLPKGSVGRAQIKSNAVTSSKVKDGSLRARDFARGQLPAGAKGDPGAKGDQGLPGTPGNDGAPGKDGSARAFALVDHNGAISTTRASKGITGVSHPDTGVYCVSVGSGIDGSTAGASLTINGDDSQTAAIADFGAVNAQCSAGQIEVETKQPVSGASGSPDGEHAADSGFYITIP